MYAKNLKQIAAELTLLVVEHNSYIRTDMRNSLGGFFKQITYATNTIEAIELYYDEKFDLIIIDIDMFNMYISRFINSIKKRDAFQMIVVCSMREHDPRLLMKLLNTRSIAGFISKSCISKPCNPDKIYKILAKVCEQVQDRKMLLHYIQELEELCHIPSTAEICAVYPAQIEDEQSDTLMCEDTLSSSPPQNIPSEVLEENDFMFFPEPSASKPIEAVNNSLYHDYFTFLESEDREELNDLLGDIDTDCLNAFSNEGMDPLHISKLGITLIHYGNVLLHYQFFSDMGASILEFGKMINNESESVATRSSDLALLISGFCSGLQTFMNEVWEKESENPKFFNDSIINDVVMLMGLITPQQSADNNDDLVFF